MRPVSRSLQPRCATQASIVTSNSAALPSAAALPLLTYPGGPADLPRPVISEKFRYRGLT